MNDITREQVPLIHDIDSYKEVTGARRFKRTKDEMERGLSPDEALKERLAAFSQTQGYLDIISQGGGAMAAKATRRRLSASRKGDITIRIRPEAGIDAEYFEKLTGQDVEIVLDEKWYGWLDNKLDCPYNGDITRLLKHILDMGIGEVITQIQFPPDLEEYDE